MIYPCNSGKHLPKSLYLPILPQLIILSTRLLTKGSQFSFSRACSFKDLYDKYCKMVKRDKVETCI